MNGEKMYKISLDKIIKSNIFMLLFLFLQFIPQVIYYVPSLSKINLLITYLQIFIYLSALFIIAFSNGNKEDKNETKSIVFFIIIFFIALMFSSIINKESIAHTFYTLFQLSVLCIYTSKILKTKDKKFIKIAFFLLFCIVLLNFIFMIMFPNGIYSTQYYYNKIYFIGSKNGFFSIIILLAVLTKICFNEKIIGKKFFIISNILSIITMLISNSSTGILAFGIFLLINFLKLSKRTFFLLYKYAIALCLIISIAVSVFRIQNYAANLIYKTFGKTTTLTGRTYIWDSAMKMIYKKPILGYGLNLKNGLIKQGKTYYYSHNLILEIIISGGIIAVICFFNILLYMAGKIKKASKYNSNEYCILAAIISYMIMGITEAPITAKALYLLIILSVYYSNEKKECVEKKIESDVQK